MQTHWRWVISGALCMSGALTVTPAAAQQVTASTSVREVAASDRLIPLTTKLRYTTMIILPDDDEILDVVCGDKEFWVINAGRNIAHIKPAKEGAATNVNLVTSSGAVYSFLLSEGGSKPPDLKVRVTADPSAAPKQVKYYSAKEVSELQAALVEARGAVRTVSLQSQEAVADFEKRYPTSLQFAHTTPSYNKPFFVKSIWHDAHATYIKADARELPSLYEVTAEGTPSLVNFKVDNGTYVVPKVLDRGYLALGKEKLEFRTKEGR